LFLEKGSRKGNNLTALEKHAREGVVFVGIPTFLWVVEKQYCMLE